MHRTMDHHSPVLDNLVHRLPNLQKTKTGKNKFARIRIVYNFCYLIYCEHYHAIDANK